MRRRLGATDGADEVVVHRPQAAEPDPFVEDEPEDDSFVPDDVPEPLLLVSLLEEEPESFVPVSFVWGEPPSFDPVPRLSVR